MKRDTVWDGIDFDILVDNIPGGVICCDTSSELRLIQYSDNLLHIVGYSREEFDRLFKNQFRELIFEEDRPQVDASIAEQMARGNSKKLEYRVVCKDGSLRWVLDRGSRIELEGGRQVYCCILLDIDAEKKSREELRVSLERQEIIMRHTADILFEWDIKNDLLTVSSNWLKKFGYEPLKKGISQAPKEGLRIYGEDYPVFCNLIQEMRSSREYAAGECRIQKADGAYIWCSIKSTIIKDREGQPACAIGVINDIDAEKRRTLKLKERAERDALTGLYNKGTAENMAAAWLENAEEGDACALLLLDMDNFKSVNDLYGHLSGDALLGDVARILKSAFRRDDIIGRSGGDEFIVVMKNVSDKKLIAHKTEGVIQALQGLLDPQGETGFRVSASVGAALFPEDGQDFRRLYYKADLALHEAKCGGKAACRFYSPDMGGFTTWSGGRSDRFQNLRPSEMEANTRIESGESNFSEYVFHTLYNSHDLEKDILLVMEIIGRRFDVSRVYIFEDSEDGLYCDNTFEWCNDGVEAQQQLLQHIPYGELGRYRDNFNEDDVFYCKDVSLLPGAQRELMESQGIKSVLQCAIHDSGAFRGFIGFDECRINRFWTEEQVNLLSIVADIISTFLLKKRTKSREVQLSQSLSGVLDRQKAWIYVVEKESYHILYANRRTREILPGIELGKSCYSSFFDRNEPCEGCPILTIEREEKEGKGDMDAEEREYLLESKLVGRKVAVTVCKQPWVDGKECYLVTCR